MMKKKIVTDSPEKTIAFAKSFAKKAKPGSVIALVGDLGSGKTTFMKGFALGLGLKNAAEVKSPTFVLMHLYPAKVPIYHFDLYRLDRAKDFRAIGLEEFMNDSNAITCIEWAEKAKKILPRSATYIYFKWLDEKRRQITWETKQ